MSGNPVGRGADERPESRLPRFSLERRITVLMLLVTVVVLGAVATVSVPLELFPSGFEAPRLSVQVPWRDAPSQEMLEKIVLPLEEELSTVAGIDAIDSYARTGFGMANLTFKQGVDMDVAYREVRDRVERARARMPEDVEQVFIYKEDASGIPIFFIGLAIDPAVVDVYNLIQDEVVLPIERIDGVASVEAHGLGEKEILIELDRERTAAAGLNIYDLARNLAGDNFTLSSGDVRHAGRKLALRSVSRYASAEELANRLVGPQTRLGDIATIRYDLPETKFRVRAMSRPAVALGVMKEGDANTLEVADRVNATVAGMQRDPRLQLVEVTELFDQGDVIRESLDTLLSSGMIGGVLALAVLLFFLRRLRMTIIVTLAIPLSLLIALTVMYFAGESLNILTLLALMISVGLLVDNSVVVAENIFRLSRTGMPRRDACIRGAGEIALAITMATLTTVIVFLPVSLVEGMFQFFLLRLSIPISVSLLGSLLVALVLVPLAVYFTLPGPEATRHEEEHLLFGLLKRWYERSFGWLNHLYIRMLDFFLRRRLDLVMLVAALFALTLGVAARQVEFVQVQEEARGGFELQVTLPQNTTLEEAEEYFLAAEQTVEGLAEELDLEGWFLFHRATFGELQGWFRSPRTNKVTPRQATERVMEELPERGGVEVFSGQDRQGESEERSQSTQVFTLVGEDAGQLETIADGLEDLFRSVPGVLGVKKAGEELPNELALELDRERSQAQGVNPTVVATVVGYALRGQKLPRFRAAGKEIPVTIRFREEDRDSLDELADFAVPTESGGLLPLSAISEPRFLASQQRIFRTNKRNSRTITLELVEGEEEAARERLISLVSRIDLPEGVAWSGAEGRTSLQEDVAAMKFAAAVSVVFIYLLMGFLFESFVLPLSIILTIPLASVGVYWAHLVTGYDLDMLGGIGLILLIGVVVNNGIVLVDYVTRLRHEGHARTEALLLAAERRFRPIMMTALTTIGGMVPLTLQGASSTGLSYKSFGLTLIGGLTTATLLTLLVVPVFYTLFDDARGAFGRVLRRALRRAASGPAAEEPG